jgi:hypothetical protein
MTPTIDIADVIAWVESKADRQAFRFEPGTFATTANPRPAQIEILNRISKIHMCSAATARVIYSSSFGLYQIMGFNIYADNTGVNGTVFDFVADPIAQTVLFKQFLAQKGLIVTPQTLAESVQVRQHFGTVYNGNGPAYANAIALALTHFGFHVQG